MQDRIVAGIRSALREIEDSIGTRPMIYIDSKGAYEINGHARNFFGDRKISVRDFMEWLVIGSKHLQNLSYGDVTVEMMRLPGNGVLAFLGQNDKSRRESARKLTAKERDILRHVVKGLSNKQIAQYLRISPGTVNSHLDSIYRKMGCSNRVAAAFLGLKGGHFLPACEIISTDR